MIKGGYRLLEIFENISDPDTNKLVLREFIPILDEEFDRYVDWLRTFDNVKYIGRPEYFLSIDKMSIYEYVNNLAHSRTDSFFKVYEGAVFIGTFKVGHINWETRSADMGIMIVDSSRKGKGLSIRIMKIGMKYAFNILGLRKLTGGLLSGNVAMQKCFEKCGFKKAYVKKDTYFFEGSYIDAIVFELYNENFG